MRLLLLSADIANPMPNVGDFFITDAIETLLVNHETIRAPLHRRPSQFELNQAKTCDALIICGTNIIGADDTVRSGWTLNDFREVAKPVIPLGLGSQANRGQQVELDAAGVNLLRFWFESSGTLSVRDRLTQEGCERVLGPGSATLTGCPSTAVVKKKTGTIRQHLVFCPPPYHYRADWMGASDWPASLVGDFFRKLEAHRSTVYLAQQPSDLLFDAAEPGWRTVYSPLYPQNHLELIASAREIVSFRIHPCLVGVANGSPAVVLCLDARTESLAQAYGIPFLRVTNNVNPDELWKLCRQKLERYPWNRIRSRLKDLSAAFHQHLENKSLALPSGKASGARDQPSLAVACISDKKYFGQQLGLMENLKSIHQGPITLHLLALDEETYLWAAQHLTDIKLFCYRLGDLWSEEELNLLQGRSVAELAYSSKARLLKMAIQKVPEAILFCDNDLFFYHSPAALLSQVPPKGALLFPQWHTTRPENRWHGLFNSGLVGVNAGADDFLDWWSRMCLRFWGKDPKKGTYFEQGFLDLAPVQFEKVHIYRGQDHNIGPWNETDVGVELPESAPWIPRLRSGEPVKSFHAASPDLLGIYEVKISWDQVTCLIHGMPLSTLGEEFREWLVTAQARHWPALKRSVFIYQTFRYRFGVTVPFPSSRILGELTRGKVKDSLSYLSWCYRLGRDTYRKIRGQELHGVELLSTPT